jgi:DNA-binding transcriptional LysR family regulator
MELRQLRYFVTVAEHESFRRASEVLFIAQPALSVQIAKLEDELGVTLFERVGRGVRLSVPGQLVLVEARRALAAAAAVARIATASAEGAVGGLRIAYTRAFPFRHLVGVLHAFRKQRPRVALDLREYDAAEPPGLVRSGEVDCAFARLTDDLEDDDELVEYPLVAVDSMVVLPSGHRLAKRRVVPLAELAREDWVVVGRSVAGSFDDEAAALCRGVGFTQRVTQETNDVRMLFGFVAAGLGVAMATTAGKDLGVRGIRFVATSPHFMLRFGLIARRDAKVPALAELIRQVRGKSKP